MSTMTWWRRRVWTPQEFRRMTTIGAWACGLLGLAGGLVGLVLALLAWVVAVAALLATGRWRVKQ